MSRSLRLPISARTTHFPYATCRPTSRIEPSSENPIGRYFRIVIAGAMAIIRLGYLYAFVALVLPAECPAQPIERLTWDNGPSKKQYHFFFDDPRDPYMVRLRKQFGIDAMTAKAKSDLERVRIVCDWVHYQWKHKGDAPPPKNDPIAILEEARQGAQFSCREYALVAAGCLNSLGIKTRIVELLPKNIEQRTLGSYHIVAEAYLNDRKKWVMLDPQWNTIPTLKNYPLNLVELQATLARGSEGLDFGGILDSMSISYREGLGQYLYFMRVSFNNRVQTTDLPHTLMGMDGLLLAPIGAEIPSYFVTRLKGRLTVTNVLPEFYGTVH